MDKFIAAKIVCVLRDKRTGKFVNIDHGNYLWVSDPIKATHFTEKMHDDFSAPLEKIDLEKYLPPYMHSVCDSPHYEFARVEIKIRATLLDA